MFTIFLVFKLLISFSFFFQNFFLIFLCKTRIDCEYPLITIKLAEYDPIIVIYILISFSKSVKNLFTIFMLKNTMVFLSINVSLASP